MAVDLPLGFAAQQAVSAAFGGSASLSASLKGFSQTYEIDAITLFGGAAPGGSPSSSLVFSALMGGLDFRLLPIPGGSIGANQVAMYPFANQAIAANAIIRQPLNISMLLIAPANPDTVGYGRKNSVMTSLVSSLQQHDNLGGTYSVTTPAYTYTNCLRLAMYDVSDGRSKQVQYMWRIDFIQPLLTIEQVQQAQSSLMQTLSSGTPIVGTPSWSNLGVGNPAGLAVSSGSILQAPSALQ